MRPTSLLAALLFLSGCSDRETYEDQYNTFVTDVESNKMGGAQDYWIEMQNVFGEWEKTGLIFGYGNDLEECEKAITGLQQENSGRQYRCNPAQLR